MPFRTSVLRSLVLWEQISQIDNTGDSARCGRDYDDLIGKPYVRPYFPINPLELVQARQWLASQGH